MMKLKTSTIENRRPYVRPVTSCLNVNYNICSSSTYGDHYVIDNGGDLEEI